MMRLFRVYISPHLSFPVHPLPSLIFDATTTTTNALCGGCCILLRPHPKQRFAPPTEKTTGGKIDETTKGEEVRWLSDTEFVYNVDHGGADIYDMFTRNTTRVPFSSAINESSSISYSRDLKYTAEYINMHDTSLYPDKTEFSMVIHDESKDMHYHVGPSPGYEIQAFKWSHGHAYACKFDSAIYYVPSPEKSPIQVASTNDEKPEVDYKAHRPNGRIIRFDSDVNSGMMWFSPSDKYLAHASNSGNKSKTVTMTSYNRAAEYDYQYKSKQARAGDVLTPVWAISIWSVGEEKAINLNFPLAVNSSLNHFDSASWVVLYGTEFLVVTWSNRWANETAITLCSYENTTCSLLYEYKYEHAQWKLDYDYASMVYSDSAIFVILPEAKEGNAWQHIAKLEVTPALQLDSISFLPSGEYDIPKILAYRSVEDVVVYEAQAPHPWNRHVYAAPAGEGSFLREDRCLSCDSDNCTFQEQITVSQGKDLWIGLSCYGPIPNYTTMISFNQTGHPEEINNITEPDMTDVELPIWITEMYNLSSGYEAIVRVHEGNTSLSSVAVTLMVYGGPEDNQVTDMIVGPPLPIGYEHAIVNIDVRGSGGRGWKYRSGTYGRLLSVEVEDTIEAMKMVLEKYPRLDRNRVGVYGWSYGGSLTTALVERVPKSFFKCAVVGAPVTNFAYYYNAEYVDRFMGDTPPSAYLDLTQNVTAFKHTKLLLVHGMRDENVMFHHSAMLIEALQEANIPFELMVYPNHAHYLTGNSSSHWYQLFKSFLSSCYE